MEPEVLEIGRDAALILLAIEWIIISLVPLAILWFATRWLRGFLPQLSSVLRDIARRVDAVREEVISACRKIVAPFVWTLSTAQGIRRGLALLLGRR